ncbi:hypothetical protein ACFE04_027156 [Oxalis oulophora]
MGNDINEVKKRTVFVTVGTTCFDKLVRAVDAQHVKQELWTRGFTHLLIQIGRGTYIPTKTVGDGVLNVDYFTFSPTIADHLRSASLVISHADATISPCQSFELPCNDTTTSGSGSIFESLRLGKPLIVVVNEDLMDNHQSELAEELAEMKHLYCARPQSLHQTIAEMNLDSLLRYTPGDAKPVAKLINAFLGFPCD